jgi:hypothetical protein
MKFILPPNASIMASPPPISKLRDDPDIAVVPAYEEVTRVRRRAAASDASTRR